jgi:hypothetical protein
MRAVVVAVSGIVTAALPLFGALDANTVGNVMPPSVESDILTSAVLTGDPVVPATFHVTVCVPLAQLTFLLGAVTAKGPAAVVTATCTRDVATAPPPVRLSRAVTWKFIVRFEAGSVSPVRHVLLEHEYVAGGTLELFRMYVRLGNVRDGFELCGYDLNSGREPSSVVAVATDHDAVPRSY